jgi:hypothetical protein
MRCVKPATYKRIKKFAQIIDAHGEGTFEVVALIF